MSKRGKTCLLSSVGCLVVVAIAVALAAKFVPFRKVVSRLSMSECPSCEASLPLIRDAILDYAEANGGKLPNAATWETDVQPFYENLVKAHPDEELALLNTTQGVRCALEEDKRYEGVSVIPIAFNVELSSVKLENIKDPRHTVLLFQSNTYFKANNNGKYDPKEDMSRYEPPRPGFVRIVVPVQGPMLTDPKPIGIK